MLINFTDPMFSNRVLGFENLVDRLERISNESQTGYPLITFIRWAQFSDRGCSCWY